MAARIEATAQQDQKLADRYWLTVIGKSLAFLCIDSAGLGDASIGKKASLLVGLGLKTRDIAPLLGTTEATVRTKLNQENKAGRSKRGKK